MYVILPQIYSAVLRSGWMSSSSGTPKSLMASMRSRSLLMPYGSLMLSSVNCKEIQKRSPQKNYLCSTPGWESWCHLKHKQIDIWWMISSFPVTSAWKRGSPPQSPTFMSTPLAQWRTTGRFRRCWRAAWRCMHFLLTSRTAASPFVAGFTQVCFFLFINTFRTWNDSMCSINQNTS